MREANNTVPEPDPGTLATNSPEPSELPPRPGLARSVWQKTRIGLKGGAIVGGILGGPMLFVSLLPTILALGAAYGLALHSSVLSSLGIIFFFTLCGGLLFAMFGLIGWLSPAQAVSSPISLGHGQAASFPGG